MKHLLNILILILVAINANARNYTAKDTTINGVKYILVSGCNESKTDDHILVNKTSGKMLIDVTHLDLLKLYLDNKLSKREDIRVLSYSIKPLFSTLTKANNKTYRKNGWLYSNGIIATSSTITNSTMQPDDVVGNVTLSMRKSEMKVLFAKWLK